MWKHRVGIRWVVLVAAFVLLAAGCDWAQFRAGPTHSGSTADTEIPPSRVNALFEAWSATTGNDVASSPAVVGDVVYVGSVDGYLYAFDSEGLFNCAGSPRTCQPLWKGPTGGAVRSSPAVVDGVVYVGSDSQKLLAFDAAGFNGCSGTPKVCQPMWTAPVSGLVQSSPTVANGNVYVGSALLGAGLLYAFDAAGISNCSGLPKRCNPRWRANLGAVTSSPAIADGVVYVGSGDQKLSAFDALGTTGCSGIPKVCQPLWTGLTGNLISSSPAVAGGFVYVGSWDGRLYAFRAGTGTGCLGTPRNCTPLWGGRTNDAIASSPAVANGVVYVGSNDNNLYAFRAGDGSGCSPLLPRTCQPLWYADTGDNVTSSPAVVNGTVYVGSNDNNLYAFDANGVTLCSGTPKRCSPLRSMALGGDVTSSPAVSDGFVYVGALDDKLHAFEIPENWEQTRYGPDGNASNPWETKIGIDSALSIEWLAAGDYQGGSPVVVSGHRMFSVARSDGTYTLRAYAASGRGTCAGTPRECAPLWEADLGNDAGAPVVANGYVYVVAGTSTQRLMVFDADGAANCDGSTCYPMWMTPTNGFRASSATSTVAYGMVYVGSSDGRLYAYDATGVTNCSGPLPGRVCSPVWTAAVNTDTGNGNGPGDIAQPVAAFGRVYTKPTEGLVDASRLAAFDADGVDNCTGTVARTCTPLWRSINGISDDGIVATDGNVYVGRYVYDASGSTGCSTIFQQAFCNPLWEYEPLDGNLREEFTTPVVANGVLHVVGHWVDLSNREGIYYAFDAHGINSCSGSPRVCSPLRIGARDYDPETSPVVANGVVYLTAEGRLLTFDAAGHRGCVPDQFGMGLCDPLILSQNGAFLHPVVADGILYLNTLVGPPVAIAP